MGKVFLLLTLISSCSNLNLEDRSMESVGLATLEEERVSPSIGERQETMIVPAKVMTNKNHPNIVLLEMGPGLERVMGFIPIVQELHRRKIKIHYVLGHGLGAVVATMFASGMSESLMEWSFYNFKTQSVGLSPYSRSWFRGVHEHLFRRFAGKRAEDLDILLFLAQYQKSDIEAVRGLLSEKLTEYLEEFSQRDPETLEYKTDIRADASLTISLRLEALDKMESKIVELGDDRKHITFYIPANKGGELPAFLQHCKLRAKEIGERVVELLERPTDTDSEQRD